jgi:hypothetical protein
MAKALETILRNYPNPYLTDAELEILLNGTPDSRELQSNVVYAIEPIRRRLLHSLSYSHLSDVCH